MLHAKKAPGFDYLDGHQGYCGDGIWTVPLGGGVGRVFVAGGQPLNVSLQAYCNVEEPGLVGPEWSIRSTVQLIFPRG